MIRIDLALPGKQLVINNAAQPMRAATMVEQEPQQLWAEERLQRFQGLAIRQTS